MKNYLKAAHDQDILVFFVLWNGAVLRNLNTINMLKDSKKLQSYIDKILIPLVKLLANEPALGGWEIMNEPEGSLIIKSDSNSCYDTTRLSGSGAGWYGQYFTMQEILTFVNIQTSAIKSADPNTLVTVGSWSERTQTNAFGFLNYYSDECLRKAGGKTNGVLDFYQIHTYSWQGKFSTSSPMLNKVSDFNLSKPLVIGEFNEQEGGGLNIQKLYGHVYDFGFNGGWGWTAESQFNNFDGIQSLKGKPYVQLNIPNHPNVSTKCGGSSPTPPTPSPTPPPTPIPIPAPFPTCTDIPPDNNYSCTQQSGWGKCGESWMQGYCCKTCFNCNCKCSDVPPSKDFTCEQQKGWGKCGESWMKGYCCKSCFNCSGCK